LRFSDGAQFCRRGHFLLFGSLESAKATASNDAKKMQNTMIALWFSVSVAA
jgi:hypothetical protein